MKQLVEEHRLYNKKCKQTNNRKDMISFDDYLKRQFGQVKYKPKKTGTYQPTDMIITRKGKNYSFSGTLDTNYTFFNLNPPKLGILAEVINIIKIVVNLQSDQIIGFEKVINQES